MTAHRRALILLARAGIELDIAVDKLAELGLKSSDLELIPDAVSMCDLAYGRLRDLLWNIELYDQATPPAPIPLYRGDRHLELSRQAA